MVISNLCSKQLPAAPLPGPRWSPQGSLNRSCPGPEPGDPPVGPSPAQPGLLSVAEELALKLAEAIEGGDKELALECAGWLAEQRAPVTVQVKPEAYPKKEIR